MSRMDSAKNIIVSDLDGTISLDTHRNHHLNKPDGTRDWDTYFSLCAADEPNEPIIHLLNMYRDRNYLIYILSGRSETMKEVTMRWLHVYRVPCDLIMMRPEKCREQDNFLKLQWVEDLGIKEKIHLVLEDRTRVVEAWRQCGFTCLQVAPGNF